METIEDILDKIDADTEHRYTIEEVSKYLTEIAARIEEAYKDEIERLNEDISRLQAALRSVLDIVMDSATSDLSMELAISEAKRIYNESMKGKNNE